MAAGRALRVHAVVIFSGPLEFVGVDRVSRAPTRAASSSGVGAPRNTLTSGSSFIDVAYDARRVRAVTRVPRTADQLAVARHDRVFSA